MVSDLTFQDDVIQKATQMGMEIVKAGLAQFPRPPGTVKLSEKEQLIRYLEYKGHPEQIQALVEQKGRMAVEHYIFNMEKLRKKYIGGQ